MLIAPNVFSFVRMIAAKLKPAMERKSHIDVTLTALKKVEKWKRLEVQKLIEPVGSTV